MPHDMSLIAITLNKCVIYLSVLILPLYNLFLNTESLKKCVIKLWFCAIFNFVFDCVSNVYMTQKICDKVLFKEPFILKYYPDRYKLHKTCDKAVSFYLLALKCVSDWFALSKMIEKLDNAVFSDDYTILSDTDFDIVTFFSNDVGLNSIKLKNVNLGDDNFGNSDPKTNNHVRLWILWINISNSKHVRKINEYISPIAWLQTRMQDWCMSEN